MISWLVLSKGGVSMDKTEKKDQVTEITEKLETGIRDMMNSDDYKNYLKTMSKFTNYSFNNSLLIAMQCPEASYVAGYRSWEANFERHVNKGEKAIKILAPAPYKIEREQDKIGSDGKVMKNADGSTIKERVEVTIPAFKAINVFDVSQTSGKELPSIGVNQLDGTVEGYSDFMRALESFSPAPITFENIENGAHGYFSPSENRIVIQEGMSELQTCKTALHEVTHSILHNKDADKEMAPDRNTKEVQAESVAYTVACHYGLDVSEYSFGYISGWSSDKELKELQSSMETIRQTARDMISGIDKELDAIHLERNPQEIQKDEPDTLHIETEHIEEPHHQHHHSR